MTAGPWHELQVCVVLTTPGIHHWITTISDSVWLFHSLFVAVLVDNFQLTLYATHGEGKDGKTIKMMDDDEEDNISESKQLWRSDCPRWCYSLHVSITLWNTVRTYKWQSCFIYVGHDKTFHDVPVVNCFTIKNWLLSLITRLSRWKGDSATRCRALILLYSSSWFCLVL